MGSGEAMSTRRLIHVDPLDRDFPAEPASPPVTDAITISPPRFKPTDVSDHACVARAHLALGTAMLELQRAIAVANPVERNALQGITRALFPVSGMLTDLERAMTMRGRP